MVIVQSREDWILFLLQILPTIYQGKEINSSLYVNLKYLRVFLGSASSGIPIVSYVGIPLEQPHWIPFFPAFIIFGGENAYFLMLTLKLICNAYVQEGTTWNKQDRYLSILKNKVCHPKFSVWKSVFHYLSVMRTSPFTLRNILYKNQ